MHEQEVYVFAINPVIVTLRALQDGMRRAGHPVGIGTGIAGEATDEELDTPDWEAAFVRWHEPELHDAFLLERNRLGSDEQADALIANALRLANNRPESAGKLITVDHLRKTQAVYGVEILPALMEDEDHPGWAALDVLLRVIAENADGLIYAPGEGFYDPDGESLLPEDEDEEEESSG